MVALMNRDQALEALKEFDGLEVRKFAPNDSYGFRQLKGDNYAYRFGERSDQLPVSPAAWDYAYRASGLPGNVISKLPTEVHAEHVVPIVDYKFRTQEKEMQALIHGDKIVGFTKGDVEIRNPRDLLLQMEKTIGRKHVAGYEVYGSLDRQYLSILGTGERRIGKTYDRKGKFVGAMMGCGVSTYVSPFGLAAPGGTYPLEINGYNHVLACTNGAISTVNVAHFNHREAGDQEFNEWFPEKVGEVWAAAEAEYDRIKAMQDVKLPDHTAEKTDSMLEQFSVPPAIRGEVASRLIDFPVDNLLGLWNHVTYVASNYAAVREDPSLVRRLLLAAGSMVRNQHICDKCHQVIKPRRRLNREVVEEFEREHRN